MFNSETANNTDELITLLEELLGDPRKHYETKEQISFDCPNCSAMKGVEYDGKGNLEVNYGLGIFSCWACSETDDTKGVLYSLFKRFGDKDILKRFISYDFKFGYNKDNNLPLKKEKLKLPIEYFKLTGNEKILEFRPAFNYLYSRRVTDDIIEKYNIGFCLTGKYQNRIVIPSYDINGELNYFITRSISKLTKNFKYLNPDTDKTQIIFNEYLIDWSKPIFLVEGVFDHIVVPNSIPLLGKKLYDKLFHDLYFKSENFIIIVLDPDAYHDAVNIFNKLNSGRLRKKILLNLLPKDYDISLFNQTFGLDNLKKWLKEKNYKLND